MCFLYRVSGSRLCIMVCVERAITVFAYQPYNVQCKMFCWNGCWKTVCSNLCVVPNLYVVPCRAAFHRGRHVAAVDHVDNVQRHLRRRSTAKGKRLQRRSPWRQELHRLQRSEPHVQHAWVSGYRGWLDTWLRSLSAERCGSNLGVCAHLSVQRGLIDAAFSALI